MYRSFARPKGDGARRPKRAGQTARRASLSSVAARSLFVLYLLLPVPGTPEEPRTLLYFWAEGCSDCVRAGLFLDGLLRAHPGLEVRRYEVTRDAANLALLFETTGRLKTDISSLPAFFFGEFSWSGFGPQIATSIEETLGGGSRPAPLPRSEPRSSGRGTLVVAFFHEETCPSCESYLRAQEIASRVVRLGQRDERVSPEAYSLLEQSGQVRFIELRKRGGDACVQAWAPLLVVGDRCVTGYEAIDAALRQLESDAPR
jgi:hypothetical protein